jgi:hypothetical protein
MAADLGGSEERIAVLTRDVSASAREPAFPLSAYGVMIRDGALAASCAINGETVKANTKIHGNAADARGNRRTFCVEFFNFSPTLSGPFIADDTVQNAVCNACIVPFLYRLGPAGPVIRSTLRPDNDSPEQ